MNETKLFQLVTGTEMKPWLSRNMLPNINTCENGWSNFSANLRVVSWKLLELTQFAWPNQTIYINFLCAVPRDGVIESTRFLMRPPVTGSMNKVHHIIDLFSEKPLFLVSFIGINFHDINSLFVFTAQFYYNNILFHYLFIFRKPVINNNYWCALIYERSKKTKLECAFYFLLIHFTLYWIDD